MTNPVKKPSALLVGSSGFLGSYLADAPSLRNAFELTTASRTSGDLRIDLGDLASFSPLREFIHRTRPTYLIVTAAITDVEACATDPERSCLINVRGTIELLSIAKQAGVIPVFFSSDYALKPITELKLLRENAPTIPETEYGRQKVLVEEYLQNHFEQFLIFRTSKLMCRFAHPRNILQHIISPLARGQELKPFFDQWMTPVFIEDIAEILAHPRLSELSGIYHLGTKRVFTRLELANLIKNRYFPDSPSRITPFSMKEIKTLEPRPHYNTLDSGKVSAALGHVFREIEDELEGMI